MKIPIKVLKDHLSEYLEKVQHGEEMIVTYHNKPVAKIVPFTNQVSTKMTRSEWINKIRRLHHSLGEVKLKEPMSNCIVRERKKERY